MAKSTRIPSPRRTPPRIRPLKPSPRHIINPALPSDPVLGPLFENVKSNLRNSLIVAALPNESLPETVRLTNAAVLLLQPG
jgi:hypothetical protein